MTDSGRARLAVFLVVGSIAVVGLLGVDASLRRGAREGETAAIFAVAARLPSLDLSLSGGARWLRMPSIEEPSAPFDLGPAMLDPDPAGGMMAPPRQAWVDETAIEKSRGPR
jgi:hypothetical protein